MKKGIHPEYHEATVKCVCGNEFKTRSTLKEISVEICASCHPFFTGQQKLIDSAGRVERFMRKYGKEYAPAAVTKTPTAENAPAEKAGEEAGPDEAKAEDAGEATGGEAEAGEK